MIFCPDGIISDSGLTGQNNIYKYIYISSRRAASTDIPDSLSPILPIVHHLWQVFRTTSRILT